MTDKIQRITEEQQQQTQKYEAKRKAFKETEQQIQKDHAALEKERAVLQEKLQHEASKMTELENRHKQDIEQLEEQMVQQVDSVVKERDFHYAELQKVRSMQQDTEKDYNEIMSTYDKEKALWENKVKFLEQQKDQAKADHAETQKKLMNTLEQLQKRQNSDRDRSDQNPMQAALEAKVREQLKEKSEALNILKSESADTIRQLEKENRELNSKMQILDREKRSLQDSTDKKLFDMQEKEKKLMNDIQHLKSERERRMMESQKMADKEREQFKIKIKDLEEKVKELENKRHEQIFAIENERTKFNMERDMLVSQKQELMEKNEMLEKRKDQLLKENTRLDQKAKQGGRVGKDWNANRPLAGEGFAAHLMKSYAQKENGSSQSFGQGFLSKYANVNKEVSTTSSDKKDFSIPMSTRDSNKLIPSTTTPNLGSPVPQRSMGSTDETGSNC